MSPRAQAGSHTHGTTTPRDRGASVDHPDAGLRRGAPQHHGEEHDGEYALEWAELLRIAVVVLATAAVWLHSWEPLRAVSVIGVLGLLVGGWPIAREAVKNLLARQMTMELSMTIAIVAAAAVSELVTALVITLFVLVAEVLEGLTVSRGRRAIRDLLDALPRSVSVRRGGVVRDVAVDEIGVGDTVLVSPGALIPVDGMVASGHSFVDQARITGESMPVEKIVGTTVYAGSINASGVLEIRTERTGRDTSYGRIIEAVERAELSRAPVQRLADRLAGYLVYFALGAAALTLLLTRNVRSTIAVVVVAGACGIAAGTPLAILGAIGQAARRGAIVKGGLPLEILAHVDTAVFDKTGTLTYGTPVVTGNEPAAGVSEEELLTTAAVAEVRSEHPFAKAVLQEAAQRSLRVTSPETFDYTPGRGIVCRSNGEVIVVGHRDLLREYGVPVADARGAGDRGSEIFVARGARLLGTIRVSDRTRDDARRAIGAIQDLGITTALLTGDGAAVATAVGSALGIDHVEAGLLPEQKLAKIDALQAAGHTVMMVGDGVNDAPALMKAGVGVAMGSGTDVARESAGVMLLGNDLTALVDTLKLARRCYRIIMANFVGTLVVDGAGVGLAAFGLLDPLVAAFIHVSSEMVFILNSARLLRHAKPERPA